MPQIPQYIQANLQAIIKVQQRQIFFLFLTQIYVWSLSSPHEARAPKLRRYHTRPLRFSWDPENVHFGKTHLRDPNMDARSDLRLVGFLCISSTKCAQWSSQGRFPADERYHLLHWVTRHFPPLHQILKILRRFRNLFEECAPQVQMVSRGR